MNFCVLRLRKSYANGCWWCWGDVQTRAELSSAAIELFATQGFVETTMETVADAAGVSRRTAYRHFANKEDLVFEVTSRWMDVLNDTIASRADGESTHDLCRRAVLSVAEHIEGERDAVLKGFGVVASTPALQSRYARENRSWLERYRELIVADIAGHDEQSLLHASVVAGAIVGGTDGALSVWAMFTASSLVAMTAAVLDRVEPLWPPESR